MSQTHEETPSTPPGALDLIERGLAEASAISHPVLRDRHRTAWVFRLSHLDPERALSLLGTLPDDPVLQIQLRMTAARDRVAQGHTDLEAEFDRALAGAEELGPDDRLRLLNDLSELAMAVAEKDRDAGVLLLRKVVPAVAGLHLPDSEMQQYQALGSALVGEALLEHDPDAGLELLHEAERWSETMPHRDTVLAFLAGALAPREPERAVRLLEWIQDPSQRLESRLQAAPNVADAELRDRIYTAAEEDARWVEHMRGPEALVRLGSALVSAEPERARAFFQRALADAEASGAQVRSLQWTGVASALAEADREWSLQIFRDAVSAADQEAEPARRVVSLAVIADEMAASFPREAAEVFSRAMEEALSLEAMWELGHVLDVVFRPDRSPYLDLRPARPLLDLILSRLSDEDPRIPGVLGLPEVGRSMLLLDRDAACDVFRRWFRAAKSAGDSDGMTGAGVALFHADQEAGRQALTEARDLLLHRVDCPAMGEYSRNVSDVAPDLVLTLAPLIPDRRERADAVAAAALGLYPTDPATSQSLIDGLERPVERSSALLALVDRLLDTGDRLQPAPLLEDLP